jgi:hypothetical protein
MENSVFADASKKLVERRNSLIKSPGFSYRDEQMDAHTALIVRFQTVIDVTDGVSKEKAAPP